MSIHADQDDEAAVPAPIAREATGFPLPGTRGKALLIAARADLNRSAEAIATAQQALAMARSRSDQTLG